jgi:hypothetical protein
MDWADVIADQDFQPVLVSPMEEWLNLITVSSRSQSTTRKRISKYKKPTTAKRKRRSNHLNQHKLYKPLPVILASAHKNETINVFNMHGHILQQIRKIIPCVATIYYGKQYHDITLIEVMYRHCNLSWVFVNNITKTIYQSSHITADCNCVYEAFAMKYNAPRKVWARQSFNQICVIWSDSGHTMSLVTLPSCVLQCFPTAATLELVQKFLKEDDALNPFYQPNQIIEPLPMAIAPALMGWKITTPTKGSKQHLNTICDIIFQEIGGNPTASVLSVAIVKHCPSAIQQQERIRDHVAMIVKAI